MNEFLDRVFLENTIEQWLVLISVVTLVALLNPLVGRLLGMLIYQSFRRRAPAKGTRFTQLILRPLEMLIILVAISAVLAFMNYPRQLDFEMFGIHMRRLLQVMMELTLSANIAWLFLRLADFIGELLGSRAAKTDSTQDDQYVLFMRDVLKVLIYLLVLFVVLGSVFDLNINSLLAGAGIAGLAVALAAQDSLANLFGSLTIFSEKPFIMGDLVETNGIQGTVEKVGFRSTRIRTLDMTYVTLPNRKIMESAMNNLSERTFRRVHYTVGLPYSTELPVLRNIVRDIQVLLDRHEKTSEDGIASFYAFGASSLDIQVIYFIKEIEYNAYLRIREEISLQIMQIVLQNGGQFAYPTTTIHLPKQEAQQIIPGANPGV